MLRQAYRGAYNTEDHGGLRNLTIHPAVATPNRATTISPRSAERRFVERNKVNVDVLVSDWAQTRIGTV
jgi:hypothetical protein